MALRMCTAHCDGMVLADVLQIMDGIISAPICLAGFFLLPDPPESTRAFYLTESVRMKAGNCNAS